MARQHQQALHLLAQLRLLEEMEMEVEEEIEAVRLRIHVVLASRTLDPIVVGHREKINRLPLLGGEKQE